MTNNNKVNSNIVISQKLTSLTTSLVTCNVAIPDDDTIPQITEGVEVLTLTITPKLITSTLYINFNSFVTNDANANSITVALFQDSTANALAAVCGYLCPATFTQGLNFRHIMTSGTTSSTTFRIRIGPNANSCYVNGTTAGVVLMGGVASTRLIITEYI